ncbi:MAG: hypothetical protein JKY67_15705 [Pseudomonadales bacterium]|nr:hypothetical protein [Pseudomonadales bacterium]
MARSQQITNQQEIHHMTHGSIASLHPPVQYALTEILKTGAQKLLAQAIEAELKAFSPVTWL